MLFLLIPIFLFTSMIMPQPRVSGLEPVIRSAAAIVLDFDTGEILFEQNAHAPRYPASMTKAMTAFIVYEEIENGNISFATLVPISANTERASTDPRYEGIPFPLVAGTYHTIDTLLHLAMLPSSNGSSVALAEFISGTEGAFVVRMNETAARLGMWAEFENSHGAVNHLSNTYSMGRLAYEFIHRFPDILRITSQSSFVFEGNVVYGTNLLLKTRPVAGADGFKDGTTLAAGRNMISTAYRNGRRIIAVQMGAPSQEWRYNDTIALLEFGFAEAARRDAFRALPENQRMEIERLEIEWEEFLRREAYASKINLVVFDQVVPYNNFHRMLYGFAMTSAVPFIEAMGAGHYVERNGNIFIRAACGREVLILAGQDLIFTGRYFLPSASPQMIYDEIFIPIRPVAEALGFAVSWEGSTRSIIVSHSAVHGESEYARRTEAGATVVAEPATFIEPGHHEQAPSENRMIIVWMFAVFGVGVLGSIIIAQLKILFSKLSG